MWLQCLRVRVPSPTPFLGGVMDLEIAMENCKVRGYIARKSRPNKKYWKNSRYWDDLLMILRNMDMQASDWETYDPEGEETSIVG